MERLIIVGMASSDFAQGKAATAGDANIFMSSFEDLPVSVAGKVAYALLPPAPDGKCPHRLALGMVAFSKSKRLDVVYPVGNQQRHSAKIRC